VVWQKQVGTPAPTACNFYCGDMATIGIVGTPVPMPLPRRCFRRGRGRPVRRIHRWSLDDERNKQGGRRCCGRAGADKTMFDPHVHSQRAAATLVNGTVYFPYGGIIGDCGDYHGGSSASRSPTRP